ncbi:DUF4197 domain-containing protein [Magnetospira sp. QH-2]|uniref:DUF4197 domain-containing protein n=1 Tax=Magnetospira sp. (strain QH-2) TaxID=1288970 RepID=UPI0003E8112D|nr:DUF4197 domain-containing protein [Magnetospira sp. QH-2]CCQ73491.1 Conserved exported protein of unknown function [Magnetospira sp. QH-2]
MRLSVLVLATALTGAATVAAAGPFDGILQGVLGGKSKTTNSAVTSVLGNEDLITGLKEALRVGTDTVVSQLGQPDGFNADPNVHVPLPQTLSDIKGLLSGLGLAGTLDDLELRMNRAAEQATPKVKQLFWDAITAMSLDDARGIYEGPDDAATQYFRKTMTPDLKAAMKPVVDDSLSQVGAVQVYNQVVTQVKTVPFAPKVNLDLTDHVLEEAVGGMFMYLAREEAAIRKDPAKQVTEILQRTFGRQ